MRHSGAVVFVLCGLSDGLAGSHLTPIAYARKVSKLVVFRNTPGPSLPHTSYICPPPVIRRCGVVALLWKAAAATMFAIVQRPDLIHGLLLMPHGIVAMIVGALTGRRFGVTLVAGPVEFFSPVGSSVGVHIDSVLPVMGRLLLKACVKAAVVGVLSSDATLFAIANGVSRNRVALLPNPVDLERFCPAGAYRTYDVISVSRLTPVKHVETVVRLTAELRPHFPQLRVAIVGDGPCMAGLCLLAHELGVAGCIDFLGYRTDIPRLLNAARIFVLTSEHEGGPMSLAEAMACGLPCVVSNCGIVPDLCTDGVDAIVVDRHDDLDSYVAGVARLLRDDALRERLSVAARRKAETLSMARAIAAWESALARL